MNDVHIPAVRKGPGNIWKVYCSGCRSTKCMEYDQTNWPPPLLVEYVEKQFVVSKKHPDTSHAIVQKMREGTLKAEILGLLTQPRHRWGLTDDQLEMKLNRSHQSVSGSRNNLVKNGLVMDSKRRRETRYGNEAIVWVKA